MNILGIILIIIISLIILGILFILFMVWGISQGLRNKFGPEWITGELQIRFNYFNVNYENNKTIKYSFSENETFEIVTQIDVLINNYKNSYYAANSDVLSVQKYFWRKSNSETYEYRKTGNDKLKAMLLLKTREMIYFK